jgi:CubicO group peptidase (beta-lactamase class C family)
LIDLAGPVPWDRLGIAPHPGWADVTVRELLDHTSGMPVARPMWFDGQGSCAATLPWLLAEPPAAHRGRWTYSNGNYCALGLLVEAVTERTLTVAVNGLVLAPAGAGDAHVSTDGLLPTDVPYALGVERLARLGGAGSFLVSTDDLARALSTVTADDRVTLAWPAVMTDQYGWGHTGTVDGAKACAWVLEGGRTVVVTTVSGSRPGTGGAVCDRTVPAIAGDLGIGAGEPERSPV